MAKSPTVIVRLPADIKDKLTQEAASQGVSVSELVRKKLRGNK